MLSRRAEVSTNIYTLAFHEEAVVSALICEDFYHRFHEQFSDLASETDPQNPIKITCKSVCLHMFFCMCWKCVVWVGAIDVLTLTGAGEVFSTLDANGRALVDKLSTEASQTAAHK